MLSAGEHGSVGSGRTGVSTKARIRPWASVALCRWCRDSKTAAIPTGGDHRHRKRRDDIDQFHPREPREEDPAERNHSKHGHGAKATSDDAAALPVAELQRR